MNKPPVMPAAPLPAGDAGSNEPAGAVPPPLGSFVGLMAGVWPWLAAALSGVLLALCMAPWNYGALCWIALTPLVCAVWFAPETSRAHRRKALLGYVTGAVYFSVTFSWLGALGQLFEQPWLRGLPLLLALYLGLYLAFWAWFLGKLRDGRRESFLHSGRNLLTGFLAAAGWVAQEWVRGWLFSGFGWNGLGVALHADLAMIQIADLTGVAGLSFLVAYCNVLTVIILRRIGAELGPVFLKKVRWEFSLSMALVALVFSYGIRSLLAKPSAATSPLRIAAIQPNIPQSEKFSPESEAHVLEQLDRLTGLAATARPQLLLWPESAVPGGMFSHERMYRFVTQQLEKGDFSLLLGTVDSDPQTGEDYNTAALIPPGNPEGLQSYRKIHLVPFGEYMPLRKAFPLFAMVAGDLVPADFTPGQDHQTLHLTRPRMDLAALVCFEDSLGDLTRRFVKNGAQLLVNLTNDGWFLETAGAEQHLHNALFRAVENRRPLVRCTNTGMTASVDRNGRVDRWLKPFEQGFAVREIAVATQAPLTFYSQHGDWFSVLCSLFCAGTLVGVLRSRLRR